MTSNAGSRMNTGELIRKYRKIRGMTQPELGNKVGLSDSAIRNYELGNREPTEEQLEAIAKALKINVQSLAAYNVTSARDALELLFRLEDSFGLKPTEEGQLSFDPKAKGAKKLSAAIKAWENAREELAEGKITQDEYDEWRASFKS